MSHFICYLKEKKQNSLIKTLLCNIFDGKEDLIGELLDNGKYDILFENKILDNISNFCVELNVYIHNNEFEKKINNNFLFAIKVSEYIKEEVIIFFDNENPYQWILINDNLFFIVDEDLSFERYGINIKSNKHEISYEEAKNLSN